MKKFCWRSAHCLMALVPVMFLSGCSGPTLGKVSGTVTIDGKPVPKGTIVFEMAGHRTATGTIADGQIPDVTSYTTGDGAAVGENRIAITSTEEIVSASGIPNPGEKEAPKTKIVVASALIPKRYNDPNTSGLSANIKKGENVLELNLTTK